LTSRSQEHFWRCDHFPTTRVVFAAPKFVKTETIKVSGEVKVALKLQNWVLADRVVRGQEGAKFQSVGSTTGVGLLSHEPTVGCGTRIADSST
jgi:hypothetical protein